MSRLTEGSGETRLSDQIAYHRSLCGAATPGPWGTAEDYQGDWSVGAAGDEMGHRATVPRWAESDAAFIAAHSPDVVSALLDVAEAARVLWEHAHPQGLAQSDTVLSLGASLAVLSDRWEAP